MRKKHYYSKLPDAKSEIKLATELRKLQFGKYIIKHYEVQT